LPYIWPEDEIGVKRPEPNRFPLMIALVVCITFTIVYWFR
jgi:hypothetical protein